MAPAPQNNQLLPKHRVLGLQPHLRLEWSGQDGQGETQKPDHSASLSDSVTSSTRITLSVHTGVPASLNLRRRSSSGVVHLLSRLAMTSTQAIDQFNVILAYSFLRKEKAELNSQQAVPLI